jgi:hypothetical protein
MLRQAWNAYRGWAKLARNLQSATQRWNLIALYCVIAAAAFGAIASVAHDPWSRGAAIVAAIASAVGSYLGQQFVGSGDEAGWIQARAAAEGIKSECFRYAARAGAYAAVPPADAAKALSARSAEIVKQATDKGLVRANDPTPDSGDKREPPEPLTKDWYLTGRIKDQIDYYRSASEKNGKAINQLWWIAFAAGLAAVLFGALGVWAQSFAPWIGAMTTIAAAIAAYGLVDRRKYLAASYAAMQSSLEQIAGLEADAPRDLIDLVTTTEDLLDGEHKAWLPQMLGMQHQALPQPQAQPQPQN